MDERTEQLLLDRIGELEEQKETLEERARDLEERLDGAHDGWRHMGVAIERPGLPVPRLEIEWRRNDNDPFRRWADYRLVTRHLIGDLIAVPLGQTRCDGGDGSWPPVFRDGLELPYRDGAHIYHDMAYLDLPGYVLCGERIEKLCSADYHYQANSGRAHREADQASEAHRATASEQGS